MPYGQNDDSKMASLLGGIRSAFGGGQPQEQPEMSEEEKRIRLAALQRLGGGNPQSQALQVNPERVAAIQRAFQR